MIIHDEQQDSGCRGLHIRLHAESECLLEDSRLPLEGVVLSCCMTTITSTFLMPFLSRLDLCCQADRRALLLSLGGLGLGVAAASKLLSQDSSSSTRRRRTIAKDDPWKVREHLPMLNSGPRCD